MVIDIKKKVFIEIIPTRYYRKISVSYGSEVSYVGNRSCIDEKEVQYAINDAHKTITEAGDIPIIKDFRKKDD